MTARAAAANEMLHHKKDLRGQAGSPEIFLYILRISSYLTKSILHGLAQQQNR